MSQTISLVVFDARRGNEEGQGREKVLGFYPTSTPMDTQISLAGLLQGLLAFSSGVLPQVSFVTIYPQSF